MTQGSDGLLADAEFPSGCGLGDAVAPQQDSAFRLHWSLNTRLVLNDQIEYLSLNW
jgi:hypothetical protein